MNLLVVNFCQEVPVIGKCMDEFWDENLHQQYQSTERSRWAFELIFASHRRQGLPTLCETRWLSRMDFLNTLLANYDKSVIWKIQVGFPGISEDEWIMVQHVLLSQCLLVCKQSNATLRGICRMSRPTGVIKHERIVERFNRRTRDLLKYNYGKQKEPTAPCTEQ